MRVLEMTAHLQKISRADGRSATAAAAYRSCSVIRCEREGVTHDYSRKGGLEANGIALPSGAPAWAADRSRLWNAAEMRERNGERGRNAGAFKANATPAREFVFSFPAELSPEGREAVARKLARHLADTHRVAVDYAIHAPGKEGDQRNYHCHMMMSSRRLSALGFGEKAREWQAFSVGARTLKEFRAFIATAMNLRLADEGKDDLVHVEHRSFKTRGVGKTPTRHEGPGRTNARRRGKAIERQKWERGVKREQTERHRQEREGVTARQDRAATAKAADIASRERKALDAVADELKKAREADAPKKGISRLMQVATAQAARLDAERQQRDLDRQQQADKSSADLRSRFNAERTAFADGQRRDAETVRERHAAEDRQVSHAVQARAERDRFAEVELRQRDAIERARDRQQERTQERPDRSIER